MKTSYDSFADDYDRFVNWPGRLAFELPFLEETLKRAPHTPGGKPAVLDAATGTGQHALALAECDYPTAGADLSAGMIARARQNAAQQGVEVRFEVAGFGELAQTFGRESFEAVLCLGNSLPHVLDEAGLAAALSDFAAVLRPGGLLLLQNRNFDQVLEQKARWMEPQSAQAGQTEWLFVRFYDFLADGAIDFNILRLQREAGGALATASHPHPPAPADPGRAGGRADPGGLRAGGMVRRLGRQRVRCGDEREFGGSGEESRLNFELHTCTVSV
jgi:glycine/sarcosine N-methyltransferase